MTFLDGVMIWLTIAVLVAAGYGVLHFFDVLKPRPPGATALLALLTGVLWPAELACWIWRGLYEVYRAIGRVGADLSRGIR